MKRGSLCSQEFHESPLCRPVGNSSGLGVPAPSSQELWDAELPYMAQQCDTHHSRDCTGTCWTFFSLNFSKTLISSVWVEALLEVHPCHIGIPFLPCCPAAEPIQQLLLQT